VASGFEIVFGILVEYPLTTISSHTILTQFSAEIVPIWNIKIKLDTMSKVSNGSLNRPVADDELRNAMRFWATGVTVVTASHNGLRHGMTANSFTSLSLTPPLVAVSLERSTRTHNLVNAAGAFGVTILSSQQDAISERFAGRDNERSDRFEGLETHTLTTGNPFLAGGLAYFDCLVRATQAAGTHTVFIGEVIATEVNPSAEEMEPLIYFNRNYRKLGN
jgi:flavin reductase (DIM6/NTAB) family NADH-FMN oxidoreductase RutF